MALAKRQVGVTRRNNLGHCGVLFPSWLIVRISQVGSRCLYKASESQNIIVDWRYLVSEANGGSCMSL